MGVCVDESFGEVDGAAADGKTGKVVVDQRVLN